MHTIFQNPQGVINQGFTLLLVFMLTASAANLVLKPKFNKYIVILSSVIVWLLCTLHTRLSFKSEFLEFIEFYFWVPWFIICFKDKLLKRLVFSALMIFTWFLTDLITYLCFSLGFGIEDYFSKYYVCASYFFTAFILIALITVLWIKNDRKKVSSEVFANTSTFLAVIYAQLIVITVELIILFAEGSGISPVSKLSIIISTAFGFIFLDLMAFFFIRYNRKIINYKAENEILKAENKAQAKYYANIKKSINETAKMHHDINNLMDVISSLVSQGDEDSLRKAENLKNEITDLAKQSEVPVYCDNKLVNLILFDKLSSAEEYNIKIVDNIILKDNCGIDDVDLCRVFVNLIDNSLRALKRYNGVDKKLVLSCRESDGVIYIKTVNKTPLEKEKRKNHGYGLNIISDICEKYNGEVVTDLNGDEFTAIVSLIPKKK